MEVEILVFTVVWSLMAFVRFSVVTFLFMEKQGEERTEDAASLQIKTSSDKINEELTEQQQRMPYKNRPPSAQTHEQHAELQQSDIKKELIELRERERRMRNIEAEVQKINEEPPPRPSFNAAGDLYTDPDGVTSRMTKGGRRVPVDWNGDEKSDPWTDHTPWVWDFSTP